MKKVNKTKIIILIALILAIVVSIMGAIFNKIDKNIDLETGEIEAKYYLFEKAYKFGVIDTEGNVVVEAGYDNIDIPNPTKDVFICTNISEYEKEESKIINSNGKELFTKYEKVDAIVLEDNGYEKQVLKYLKDGKYGLINFDGKELTGAIYDDIQELKYKEGNLLVSKDGKCGVLNSKAKEVIKPKYDSIEGDGHYNYETKYNQTGYIVCKKEKDGYKYGYFNNKGKQILKNEYSEVYRVLEASDKEEVYLIARKNGKVGFIKKDKKILDYEYQNIEYDSLKGLIKVQRNANFGVYNINGEEILPVKYQDISFRGKYIYTETEGKPEYYGVNGQLVKNLDYLSINETDNENYYTCISADGLYGILDKNENILVENEYNYLEYLYNDYFIAIEDEKLGVIKTNNDIMIPFEYDTINKLDGTNIVQATKENGEIDIFDKDLKSIHVPEDIVINEDANGVKIYSTEGNKYFNKEGKEIKPQEVFSNNSLFAKVENGLWGFEDKSGKVVIKCEYEYVTEFNKYGYAGIKANGKWGSIDTKGNIIVEPKLELDDKVYPNYINKFYTLEAGSKSVYFES